MGADAPFDVNICPAEPDDIETKRLPEFVPTTVNPVNDVSVVDEDDKEPVTIDVASSDAVDTVMASIVSVVIFVVLISSVAASPDTVRILQ